MKPDQTPLAEPREGTIYRDPGGRPMLFVRVEAGEAVFVGTHDRVVYTRRYPAVPSTTKDPTSLPELTLVHDPEARQAIRSVLAEASELDRQNRALSVAMKEAVSVVPVAVANRLRAIFREAKGGK